MSDFNLSQVYRNTSWNIGMLGNCVTIALCIKLTGDIGATTAEKLEGTSRAGVDTDHIPFLPLFFSRLPLLPHPCITPFPCLYSAFIRPLNSARRTGLEAL